MGFPRVLCVFLVLHVARGVDELPADKVSSSTGYNKTEGPAPCIELSSQSCFPPRHLIAVHNETQSQQATSTVTSESANRNASYGNPTRKGDGAKMFESWHSYFGLGDDDDDGTSSIQRRARHSEERSLDLVTSPHTAHKRKNILGRKKRKRLRKRKKKKHNNRQNKADRKRKMTQRRKIRNSNESVANKAFERINPNVDTTQVDSQGPDVPVSSEFVIPKSSGRFSQGQTPTRNTTSKEKKLSKGSSIEKSDDKDELFGASSEHFREFLKTTSSEEMSPVFQNNVDESHESLDVDNTSNWPLQRRSNYYRVIGMKQPSERENQQEHTSSSENEEEKYKFTANNKNVKNPNVALNLEQEQSNDSKADTSEYNESEVEKESDEYTTSPPDSTELNERYRISEHESPPEPPTRPNYTREGGWAHPPPQVMKNMDFIPLQTYTQVRRYETVRHLSPEDALSEATSEEEYINAPRLREVVSHRKTSEVYSEEGYEDSAYDHGGYNKEGEHHEVVPGYESSAQFTRDPVIAPDQDDHDAAGSQLHRTQIDSQGSSSIQVPSKTANHSRHGQKSTTEGTWSIVQIAKDDSDRTVTLKEGGNITSPTTLRPTYRHTSISMPERYASRHVNKSHEQLEKRPQFTHVNTSIEDLNYLRNATSIRSLRKRNRNNKLKRPLKESKIPSQLLGFKYAVKNNRPKSKGKKNSPLAKRKRKMKYREKKKSTRKKQKHERQKPKGEHQKNIHSPHFQRNYEKHERVKEAVKESTPKLKKTEEPSNHHSPKIGSSELTYGASETATVPIVHANHRYNGIPDKPQLPSRLNMVELLETMLKLSTDSTYLEPQKKHITSQEKPNNLHKNMSQENNLSAFQMSGTSNIQSGQNKSKSISSNENRRSGVIGLTEINGFPNNYMGLPKSTIKPSQNFEYQRSDIRWSPQRAGIQVSKSPSINTPFRNVIYIPATTTERAWPKLYTRTYRTKPPVEKIRSYGLDGYSFHPIQKRSDDPVKDSSEYKQTPFKSQQESTRSYNFPKTEAMLQLEGRILSSKEKLTDQSIHDISKVLKHVRPVIKMSANKSKKGSLTKEKIRSMLEKNRREKKWETITANPVNNSYEQTTARVNDQNINGHIQGVSFETVSGANDPQLATYVAALTEKHLSQKGLTSHEPARRRTMTYAQKPINRSAGLSSNRATVPLTDHTRTKAKNFAERRMLTKHNVHLDNGKDLNIAPSVKISSGVLDREKFPFYGVPKTTLPLYSPLRYALNPWQIPSKSEGGMEFYESRDKLIQCENPQPPKDIIPEREEDGEWVKNPQPDGPRMGKLGDAIGCLRVKLFGQNPLDNPFFKETTVGLPQETALIGALVPPEGTPAPKMYDQMGFYKDILENIRRASIGPKEGDVKNRPYLRVGLGPLDSKEASSEVEIVRVQYNPHSEKEKSKEEYGDNLKNFRINLDIPMSMENESLDHSPMPFNKIETSKSELSPDKAENKTSTRFNAKGKVKKLSTFLKENDKIRNKTRTDSENKVKKSQEIKNGRVKIAYHDIVRPSNRESTQKPTTEFFDLNNKHVPPAAKSESIDNIKFNAAENKSVPAKANNPIINSSKNLEPKWKSILNETNQDAALEYLKGLKYGQLYFPRNKITLPHSTDYKNVLASHKAKQVLRDVNVSDEDIHSSETADVFRPRFSNLSKKNGDEIKFIEQIGKDYGLQQYALSHSYRVREPIVEDHKEILKNQFDLGKAVQTDTNNTKSKAGSPQQVSSNKHSEKVYYPVRSEDGIKGYHVGIEDDSVIEIPVESIKGSSEAKSYETNSQESKQSSAEVKELNSSEEETIKPVHEYDIKYKTENGTNSPIKDLKKEDNATETADVEDAIIKPYTYEDFKKELKEANFYNEKYNEDDDVYDDSDDDNPGNDSQKETDEKKIISKSAEIVHITSSPNATPEKNRYNDTISVKYTGSLEETHQPSEEQNASDVLPSSKEEKSEEYSEETPDYFDEFFDYGDNDDDEDDEQEEEEEAYEEKTDEKGKNKQSQAPKVESEEQIKDESLEQKDEDKLKEPAPNNERSAESHTDESVEGNEYVHDDESSKEQHKTSDNSTATDKPVDEESSEQKLSEEDPTSLETSKQSVKKNKSEEDYDRENSDESTENEDEYDYEDTSGEKNEDIETDADSEENTTEISSEYQSTESTVAEKTTTEPEHDKKAAESITVSMQISVPAFTTESGAKVMQSTTNLPDSTLTESEQIVGTTTQYPEPMKEQLQIPTVAHSTVALTLKSTPSDTASTHKLDTTWNDTPESTIPTSTSSPRDTQGVGTSDASSTPSTYRVLPSPSERHARAAFRQTRTPLFPTHSTPITISTNQKFTTKLHSLFNHERKETTTS